VRIGFLSAEAARTFSEFELMTRAFGAEVAYKLANRLALLSAAGNLALVPTTPPIALRPLDGEAAGFAVTICPAMRLAFTALDAAAARQRALAKITEIEIRGVEHVRRTPDPRTRRTARTS
jgi:hypothetical protein